MTSDTYLLIKFLLAIHKYSLYILICGCFVLFCFRATPNDAQGSLFRSALINYSWQCTGTIQYARDQIWSAMFKANCLTHSSIALASYIY